jgi:hypothetical protein
LPTLELLEYRTLPSGTTIHLDPTGAATQAGTIQVGPLPGTNTQDQYTFTAAVTGRISVLMRAESARFISKLTAPGTTILDSAVFASTLDSAGDDVIQFNVDAGNTYQLVATGDTQFVATGDAVTRVATTGNYELIISTETAAFSPSVVHPIALDASGSGVQLGTILTPGEVDLYSFTMSVTGQATVHVNAGVTDSTKGLIQEAQFIATAGQSCEVQVSDPGSQTGLYVLTITTIADAILDSVVHPIALDATGSGSQSGAISYSGDTDTFQFTAPLSGTMTLKMQNPPSPFECTLLSAFAVSPAAVTYDTTFSRQSLAGQASDQIVQFQVVQGQEYTVRVWGANGSTGAYVLSLSMAEDKDSATIPQLIDVNSPGVSGSIVVPGDQDLYQFTAQADGYVLVVLSCTPGTNLQGLLTFPSTTFPTTPVLLAVKDDQGNIVTNETIVPSGVGVTDSTRDEFAVIHVNKGQTYQFLVSGGKQSIGAYHVFLVSGAEQSIRDEFLMLSTNNTGDRAIIATGQLFGVLVFTFDFQSVPPGLVQGGTASAPESEGAQVTSTVTNIRLAAFALPSAGNSGNTTTTTTTTTVTVPSGTSTQAPNSLIATLLTVAARDSSLVSTDSVLASATGSATTTVATTALLVALAGPSSGGSDMGVVAVIGGSVFQDVEGNGTRQGGEAGIAGETIVLEMKKAAQYVLVGQVTTDATGAFVFAGMGPGDYRVRYLGAGANLSTPASYAVKVTGNGAVKVVHFGKGIKRGHRHAPPDQRGEALVHVQEASGADAIDRVFVDWCADDVVRTAHDEGERAARDWWLALLSLAPAAILGLVKGRPDTYLDRAHAKKHDSRPIGARLLHHRANAPYS